jgi:hypothetical protein
MSLLNEASFLVTPNSYKEDKLYAAIPTNGNGDMTVTRATTATRVNEAGLIELVPYNLLSRSEEFDNADWTKTNCTITANDTTAPDGYTSADRVTVTALAQLLPQSPTLTIGQPFVFSVFVKEGNWGIIRIGNQASATNGAWFNVTNGTAGTINGGTSEIIDYGNGWYRLIAKFTSFSTGVSFIGLSNADGSTTTSAIGTFMYVWGAQLVKGSSALTYQKTVDRLDIPRIDYTGGGCPSILLEPQRTNLVTNSASTASWVSNSNTTPNIVLGADIAPDGTQTAMNIPFGATGYAQSNKTTPADTLTYTASFYAKSITGTGIIGTGTFGFAFGSYVVGTIFNFATLQAGSQWTATAVGNGWYRLSISLVNTNQTIFVFRLDSALTTANNVMFWGAQLEAGAYPTSYIPTTTGTVTRNADAISKTSISDLIGQTEGVLFVEMAALSNDGTFRQISLSDGSTDNRILLDYTTVSNQVRMFCASGGTSFVNSNFNITNSLSFNKIAFKYKINDFALWVNGVEVATDLSGSVPIGLNRLTFDNGEGTFPFFGKVKQLQVYKTALTDTQLAALTT